MRTPLTATILLSYYPAVHRLQEHLAQVIKADDDREVDLTHETDTLNYRKLLRETWVAAPSEVMQNKHSIIPVMEMLREVRTYMLHMPASS